MLQFIRFVHLFLFYVQFSWYRAEGWCLLAKDFGFGLYPEWIPFLLSDRGQDEDQLGLRSAGRLHLPDTAIKPHKEMK
ncbi:hypothetical protein E2C01_089957 [Portunus trituberculatus]|uniref:Secreted protein n=1 Tax=Portunus trituberculatus TaxID=210409 RepID=A0A5B7JK59_PORTR|nr:hypothetical protein [Portunus trituberculatus]